MVIKVVKQWGGGDDRSGGYDGIGCNNGSGGDEGGT